MSIDVVFSLPEVFDDDRVAGIEKMTREHLAQGRLIVFARPNRVRPDLQVVKIIDKWEPDAHGDLKAEWFKNSSSPFICPADPQYQVHVIERSQLKEWVDVRMSQEGWDNRWMDMLELVATWSKDRSRKTAALIVDQRNVLLSIGWNGFPRNIDDGVYDRHERPAKYQWTEHAERNAIYNAAAVGIPLLGARMYLGWYPCADCARAIIQAGIRELICIEPDWNDPQWGKDFAMVEGMLGEGGVGQRFMAGRKPPEVQ